MPQPGPQTEAIRKHGIDELFYGGAVGGGKSDYLLGDFAQDITEYGSAWRGILFRKTYGELEELMARALEIYPQWFPGAQWSKSDKEWRWPNGAWLRLRYLEHTSDWQRYWGHQYTWIGWDELPMWSDLTAYHKIKARLRSAHGVPNKRIRSTGNPGGAGHQAVKTYFGIDGHPNGGHIIDDPVTGMKRLFIRARVSDNKILLQNDPTYIDRLKGVGSEALVRAYLDGDWSVVVGAYFDCWRADKHVIRPFKLEPHWTRFRSLDWGSARPFSVGWWTILSEDFEHPDGFVLPKNAMVRYREWYGMKEGEPNVGLKMPAEAVAEGIIAREADDPKDHEGRQIHYGVADPAIHAQDGGPSIAERHLKLGLVWRKADNKRVAERGRMGGWDQLRGRMIGDGKPMIYCFSTCHDSIRTIPALQHDENRPEDVDTESEDHAGDEWRYACMSRPWARPMPKSEPVRWQPTINEMIAARTRARKQQEY